MSNYFDIYCRTCSVEGNVFHANHGGPEIARVCHDLPVLKEIALAMRRLTSPDLGLGWPSNGRDNVSVITEDLLEFAVIHAGHDVAARSEYGNFHDRCSKNWTCGTCGSNVHACQLPPKHDGDCGPLISITS